MCKIIVFYDKIFKTEGGNMVYEDFIKLQNELNDIIVEYTCFLKKGARLDLRDTYEYKDEISKLEIGLQNSQIQLKDLEDKKIASETKLSDMRKRLSDVENKNHSITESLDKMESDRAELNRKIKALEEELSELKNLQVSLKVILPQMKNYFAITEEDNTVLLNISETDFESDKKITAFIDFSNKIKIKTNFQQRLLQKMQLLLFKPWTKVCLMMFGKIL